MEIRILTDSSAEYTKANEEFICVNMPINFEGEEDETENGEIFWEKLISGKVARTSQPSREELKEHFQFAKDNNIALICIFISSALSGTYNMAVSVKNEVNYNNIYLVDSLLATYGEQLLVEHAIKLKNQHKDAQQIYDELNTLKTKIKVFACIDSLKYLARGGRINKNVATIGNLIKLKPIITINNKGEVTLIGKKIGLALATNELINLTKNINPNFKTIPIYSHNNKNCLFFLKKLKEKVNLPNLSAPMPIGAVIGTHIGPGGFGIVYVEN